ncbi:MAG TPA: hypothetical protein QGH10_15190 [Armatimonadota bacterium]|nr:hypothetical protein [Armatimonadota bacterium]
MSDQRSRRTFIVTIVGIIAGLVALLAWSVMRESKSRPEPDPPAPQQPAYAHLPQAIQDHIARTEQLDEVLAHSVETRVSYPVDPTDGPREWRHAFVVARHLARSGERIAYAVDSISLSSTDRTLTTEREWRGNGAGRHLGNEPPVPRKAPPADPPRPRRPDDADGAALLFASRASPDAIATPFQFAPCGSHQFPPFCWIEYGEWADAGGEAVSGHACDHVWLVVDQWQPGGELERGFWFAPDLGGLLMQEEAITRREDSVVSRELLTVEDATRVGGTAVPARIRTSSYVAAGDDFACTSESLHYCPRISLDVAIDDSIFNGEDEPRWDGLKQTAGGREVEQLLATIADALDAGASFDEAADLLPPTESASASSRP